MGEGVKSVIMAQEQGGRVSTRTFRISTLWLWTLHGKIDFGGPPLIGVCRFTQREHEWSFSEKVGGAKGYCDRWSMGRQ